MAPMPHVEVKLDLVWPELRGDEDGGPLSIADTIVEAAARQLLEGIDKDVKRGLRDRVSAVRNEVIREAVKPVIDEALQEPLQRTNSFGEPVGQETTLRELIIEETRKQWQQANNNSGGVRRRETYIEKVVREEIEKTFAAELKVTIDEAKAGVLEAVRAKGAQVLAETIQRAARTL